MKQPRKFRSLNSFLAEEAARDPAFGQQFERAKARVIKSRLGRPPSTASERQLRFRADARLAERIRKAAEKEHRSVSNWLEIAAGKRSKGREVRVPQAPASVPLQENQ